MKQLFLALILLISAKTGAQSLMVFADANGKLGYKDNNGKTIVAAKYSEASPVFYYGRALVKRNNKYGFIDTKGQEIIPAQFDSAGIFSFGSAEVVRDKKRFSIDTMGMEKTLFDFDALDLAGFFGSGDLKSLGKVNIRCDRFTNGTYNGEVSYLGEADGYGTYTFEDSSFYCGHFTSGEVKGIGVFFDKPSQVVYTGNWEKGKLQGDYYLAWLNTYKVQILSATPAGGQYRAAMQINGKYVITSNLLHASNEKKHNLINILDESGISTMYGSVNTDLLFDGQYASFDSQNESLKVNSCDKGVYIANISTQSYYNDGAVKDAEKTLKYEVPKIIYPKKLLNNYDKNERYFGRVENNIPAGFGSIASAGSNFHLLTGMFSNGKATGFKTEIFNSKEGKFFYAGDFGEAKDDVKGVVHTGDNLAKFIYREANDLTINMGKFTGDEILSRGIIVNLRPGFTSVTFHNAEGTKDKGYLFLPKANTIYRGELAGNSADGNGEYINDNSHYKGKFATGKFVEEVKDFPVWYDPTITFMFDHPFKLIEDK